LLHHRTCPNIDVSESDNEVRICADLQIKEKKFVRVLIDFVGAEGKLPHDHQTAGTKYAGRSL
jgi:hypothetical protein